MSDISELVAKDAPTEQVKAAKSAGLRYIPYGDEKESVYLPAIRQLISRDLSEPYSIYVYRYFLYRWGNLCFMVCFPPPLVVRERVCLANIIYLRRLTSKIAWSA